MSSRSRTSEPRWTPEPASLLKPDERPDGPVPRPAASVERMAAALEEAAARVNRDWGSRESVPMLLEGAASEELEGLVSELRAAAEGGREANVSGGRNPILRRRLLERLHLNLLDVWSDHPDSAAPDEMLYLLRRIAEARHQLDPEWGHDLAALLSAPDGMGLVAEIAHDLRSPLTAVLFLSDTLRRGQSGPLNDTQQRQIGLVYSASLNLIEVASDLIELARGGDRLGEGERRVFSIAETLESVRGVVEPMSEEKGLTLRLRPAEPDRRSGHPVALSRVLLNLATNALKFTREGLVEIVARAVDATRVEFSVRDTGTGIPDHARENLYLPFRLRSDSGFHFSGTGLGLTIARRLVQAMGSELSYETSPSWGTRFYFQIEAPPVHDEP